MITPDLNPDTKDFYIKYGYIKKDYPFYDKLCEITGLK